MKLAKKTASSSSPQKPSKNQASQKIKSQPKVHLSNTPKTDLGFILLAVKDIPVAVRSRLLPKGIAIGANEKLSSRLQRLQKENQHLKSISMTDELTGLYNRRFFNRQMNIEIARAKRTGESFCLIFIDLDNFKVVNDTLGHDKGDFFLKKICREMAAHVRPTDFACRFGGDEFAFIMPATSLRDGVRIAQRWHELILRVAGDMNLPVSSSIGVDEYDASCKLDVNDFVHRVDQYLYEAKQAGKGKIAHPAIEISEPMAVTWAEKEILYHIFQPAPGKKQAPLKAREIK